MTNMGKTWEEKQYNGVLALYNAGFRNDDISKLLNLSLLKVLIILKSTTEIKVCETVIGKGVEMPRIHKVKCLSCDFETDMSGMDSDEEGDMICPKCHKREFRLE